MNIIARRLFLLTLSGLVSIVLLEILLRFTLPLISPPPVDPLVKSDIPGVGYIVKPNFRYGKFVTNSKGFINDQEFSPLIPPGTRRIIVVGDSVTQGNSAIRTYPWFLSQLLNKTEKWEVINAAVSGYNHEQVIARLDYLVTTGWKTDIVIYGICPNDIFPPDSIDSEGALKKDADSDDNQRAKKSRGREYAVKSPLKKSALVKLLVKFTDTILAATNRPPLLFERREYKRYCDTVNRYYRDEILRDKFRTSLMKFQSLSERYGFRPVLLLFPQTLDLLDDSYRKIMLERVKFFKAFADEHNILFLDLSDILSKRGIFSSYVIGDPVHPNESTHEAVAKFLLPRIQDSKGST